MLDRTNVKAASAAFFMQKIVSQWFFLLCLSLCLISCKHEKLAAMPAGTSVLVLGDSLSYGTGAGEHQDYPSLLAASTGWQIINAGVPGNTSAQGLERLPALLEQYQPTVVMLELGGNDFLQGVPTRKTIDNLNAIINTAKAKNAKVWLVAIPEFSPVKAAFGALSDHPLYEKLAQETQVPLIENAFSEVLSDHALKADQIHPNAQGYRVVADKMRASFTEMGLLRSQ